MVAGIRARKLLIFGCGIGVAAVLGLLLLGIPFPIFAGPGRRPPAPFAFSREILAILVIVAFVFAPGLSWYLDLRRHSRHLRLIIDTMPAYIFAKNAEGRYILANKAMADFFYVDPEDMMGKTDADFGMTKEDFEAFRDQDRQVIESGAPLVVSEHEGLRFDHSPGWFQTTKVPYHRPGSKNTAILGITVDITELKLAKTKLQESEERYRLLAQHDSLTGLPNRALFSDRLGQALALSQRAGGGLALAFVDLDRFKDVNDRHGHAVGDLMLKEAAARMTACLRASDVVGRLGGDEFIVLLPGVESAETARLAGDKLRTAMEEPFLLGGHSLGISASIGLALFPRDGEDETSLTRHADEAMYRSKAEGRNRVTVYGSGAA